MKKLNNTEFIDKAILIHNGKYDYSLIEYKTNKTKIKIICPIHGVFEQTPNCHLSGQGCQQCGNESFKEKKKLTKEGFIERAILRHGNKYDYSLLNYKSYEEKVKIICPIHGAFEQTPHSHLNGSSCQRCGNVNSKTLNEIIFLSKLKHDNKYDYSKSEYINAKTKLKIICPKHGEFEQLHNHHILGQGCPICKESKGEKAIRVFLSKIGLNYIKQKKFNGCKDIRPLPFDFYLSDLNLCIEYDGEQHFKPVKRFGGVTGFEMIQKRDRIKTKFCFDNNINLIRISYKDDVNEKLNGIFCN